MQQKWLCHVRNLSLALDVLTSACKSVMISLLLCLQNNTITCRRSPQGETFSSIKKEKFVKAQIKKKNLNLT